MAQIVVQATLIFDEADEQLARSFVTQVQARKNKWRRTIKDIGALGEMERPSEITIHRCYHDEDGDKPCEVLVSDTNRREVVAEIKRR